MQRLRQWLIETEHKLNTPLVFQHCDFVDIEEHINQQQVTEIFSFHFMLNRPTCFFVILVTNFVVK